MSEHTPGPWQIERFSNYFGWSVYGPEDGCIAERWYDKERSEDFDQRMHANARLIAAAPDLLAALEEVQACLAAIAGVSDLDRLDIVAMHNLERRWDRARDAIPAAIAKARGETKP